MRPGIILAFAGLSSGCLGEGPGVPPCTGDGECLPGFVCSRGYCVLDQSDAGFDLGIGPAGGKACGADGVCLVVPPGALQRPARISISRASGGTRAGGVVMVTRAYAMTPTATAFLVEASAEIPVSATSTGGFPRDAFEVFRAEGVLGPWSVLEGATTATLAIAKTERLGLFTVGLPLSLVDSGVHDASGFPDTGRHRDATFEGVDFGVPDVGPDEDLDGGVSEAGDAGQRADAVSLPDIDRSEPRDAAVGPGVPDLGDNLGLPDIGAPDV